MGLPQHSAAHVSPEQYLAQEMASETRSEYLAGEVFAMTGASSAHNIISLNVATALRNHLRGGPCQAFMVDIKLRVEAANAYFYPDVMVTCSESDRSSTYVKSEPVLVVEVLSPSTALFDRDKKFAAYRQLASLQEYVLIDSQQVGVECYRRGEGGEWILHPYGPEETVALHSVGLSLPVAAVYQDAELGEA